MTSRESSESPLLVVEPGQRPHDLTPAPVDRLLRPVRLFAQHHLADTGLLIAGAVIAVWLANSSWAEPWAHVLHVPIGFSIGEYAIEKSLLHWINDGLMGIFFFVVGLEIKREVKVGELSTPRKAALPGLAALGGMVVPAGLYYAFNPTGATSAGWGIPMATDIAFALGVLALLGDRVPNGLKIFLMALAIADDIGAVLVIAIFYTDAVAVPILLVAGALLAVSYSFNKLNVRSPTAYLLVGLAAWLAFLESGVHATVAALLMAFTIPARTRISGQSLHDNVKGHLARLYEVGLPQDDSLNTAAQQAELDAFSATLSHAGAPLSRLEHALSPPVTFLVLPVFALANAGVRLPADAAGAFFEPVAAGTLVGLTVGKTLGVITMTWLAVRAGVASLPSGVSFRHVFGVALLAGIGFTMALFITNLAFTDAALIEQAKVGVLTASVLAGVAGYVWLRYACFVPSSSSDGNSDAGTPTKVTVHAAPRDSHAR